MMNAKAAIMTGGSSLANFHCPNMQRDWDTFGYVMLKKKIPNPGTLKTIKFKNAILEIAFLNLNVLYHAYVGRLSL